MMLDTRRRAEWQGERWGRAWVLVAVCVAIAVLLAACGDQTTAAGDGANTPTTPVDAQATTAPEGAPQDADPDPIAFASCMRANGVPDFPDPVGSGSSGSGGFRISGDISSNPNFEPAMNACAHLRPTGGPTMGQGAAGVDSEVLLEFAKCMRENGVPGFPDPGAAGSGLADLGIDTNSPQFQAAIEKCQEEFGIQIQVRR